MINYSGGSSLAGIDLVSIQLSYSTADVESFRFFGERGEAQAPTPGGLPENLIVVHGEYVRLDKGDFPDDTPGLTEEAGILRPAEG